MLILLLVILIVGFLVWGLRGLPVLQYLFLLRFQLTLSLFLILFPILAVTWGRQMLGNLLVLERPEEFVAVAAMAPMLAWLVGLQTLLVVRRAPERCDVRPLPVPPWVFRWRIPFFGALALPILILVVIASPGSRWHHAMWCVVGVGLAFVTLVLTTNLHALTVQPSSRQEDFLLNPNRWVLAPLRKASGIRYVVPRWIQRVLGPGYVDAQGELLPGHGLSAVLFFVTTLFYFAGYFFLAPPNPGVEVPALFYLLILVASLGWLLTGAALYLDRWRVPVVLGIAAYALLIFVLNETDHYFTLATSAPDRRGAPLEPGEVLDAWLARESGRKPILVVVAAAGGGIQASAWTAQVLTGLRQTDFGDEFGRSLRFISAVSGGSVGTMYVVDDMSKGFDGDSERLQRLVLMAGKSSLTASAWGLAYPDLLRVLSPFPPLNPNQDRASIMEDVWRSRLVSARQNPKGPTFADWIPSVRQGLRPATIFNATIVNTGGRLLLGTALVPEAPGAAHITDLYQGQDISIVTAARLSATFPYVTPVARALLPEGTDGPQYYIADGGYYDNFGMATALDWLRRVISDDRDYGRKVRAILVLQIQLSPETLADSSQARRVVAIKQSRSWVYASLGPALTLTSVRTATQKARNSVDFQQLKARLRDNDVCLEQIIMHPDQEGPLSWHLSQSELKAVVKAWQSDVVQAKVQRIRTLFKADSPCPDMSKSKIAATNRR